VFSNAQAAQGSIRTVTENEMVDNQRFTLSDGVTSKTFCFKIAGTTTCPAATTVIIDVETLGGGNQSALVIAGLIRDAVNAQADLNVTASVSSSQPHVRLVNDDFGGVGNVAMTENVADGDFVVIGMAGGAGLDCATGQACRSASDCRSGLCTNNLCE
jgi:hypothetical protein